MKIFIPLMLFTLIFNSCTRRPNKKLIIKYFASGKIKSRGMYLRDTIPVDTLFQYYTNGNDSLMSIYDNNGTGNLTNTSIYYNQNGNKSQESNYLYGSLISKTSQYTENGKCNFKSIYYNHNQVGDDYEFDTLTGKVSKFKFYNFTSDYLNYNDYDEKGLIKKNESKIQLIFKDTFYISALKNKKLTNKIYNYLLLISNPPHFRTAINFYYYGNNGELLKKDSIANQEILYLENQNYENLSHISIVGKQFDSITGKTKYQKEDVKLEK